MATHLRLFPAADEREKFDDDQETSPDVRISLGDLLPLVALAQKRHFIWLQDFLDDEVMISGDLHDVLLAFRSSKPSA